MSYRFIDNEFVDAFFVTFHLFCTSSELLDLLIQRFQVPTPLNIAKIMKANEDSYYRFLDNYKRPIQKRWVNLILRNGFNVRVLQVIYFWISRHFHDFNSKLLHKLQLFIDGKNDDFTVLQRIWCVKMKVMHIQRY